MTDGYNYLDKVEKEYRKSLEKADYFFENKDYTRALEEYVYSFNRFSLMYQMNQRKDEVSRAGRTPHYTAETKINFLFIMSQTLYNILKCYGGLKEDNKVVILLREFLQVHEKLGENERDFTVNQLKSFEALSETVNSLKVLYRSELAALEEAKIDDYLDETLKKIYKAYNEICDLEICLLEKRKIPGSSTLDWQSPLLSLLAFGIAFLVAGQNLIVGIVAAVICWIVVSDSKKWRN